MVSIRKMTEAEFAFFAQYSIQDYAKDLMQNCSLDPDSAIVQAQQEFSELLPCGSDTPDNTLMVIEADGHPVGAIWYLYELTDGIRHAFLNDFIIAPKMRRRGYASAALTEMEAHARAHGCTECRLYVWDGNIAARELYAKCGYTAFRESDDGIYMRKPI